MWLLEKYLLVVLRFDDRNIFRNFVFQRQAIHAQLTLADTRPPAYSNSIYVRPGTIPNLWPWLGLFTNLSDRTYFFWTADGRMQRTVSCSLEFLPRVRSLSDCVFDFKLIDFYEIVSVSYRSGIVMTWNYFYVACFLRRRIFAEKEFGNIKDLNTW